MSNIQGIEKNSDKHNVYLVGGIKGGTGKSHFTRILLEFFVLKSWQDKFTLIEADPCIGDVSEIYDDCQKIIFSDNKFQKNIPNLIFKNAIDKTVIVNLPSNIKRSFDSWLIQSKMLTLEGSKYYGKIVYFFVSDGSFRSVEQFIKHIDTYKQQLKQLNNVLVLNRGRLTCGEHFNHLEDYDALMSLIKEYKIPVLVIPEFESSLQFFCDRQSYTYSQAQEKAEFFMDKQRISNYLNEVQQVFGQIFTEEPDLINLNKLVEKQKKSRDSKQLPIPRESELLASYI